VTNKWRVEVNNFKKQHEIELYDREKSYLRRNREVKIEKKRDTKEKIGKNRTHTHAQRERERERDPCS
jgi:hypothetical protein